MRGLLPSLAFLVIFIVAVWAVGQMLGFEISLWGMLIASIVLTVVLNLVMALFRKA